MIHLDFRFKIFVSIFSMVWTISGPRDIENNAEHKILIGGGGGGLTEFPLIMITRRFFQKSLLYVHLCLFAVCGLLIETTVWQQLLG